MIHSFDIEDAKKYGVTEAIILYNLRFWIEKNKANEKHFYDGRYWTYNSVKAFEELFPYLTYRNIRSAIDKLIEFKVIITGNYNQSSYDRTRWFALFDLPELTNGFAETDKTVNTDIKQIKNIPASFDARMFLASNGATFKYIDDWLKVRKAKKAANTETAMSMFCKEVEKSGIFIDQALEMCIVGNWQSFKADWVKGKVIPSTKVEEGRPPSPNPDWVWRYDKWMPKSIASTLAAATWESEEERNKRLARESAQ